MFRSSVYIFKEKRSASVQYRRLNISVLQLRSITDVSEDRRKQLKGGGQTDSRSGEARILCPGFI